MQKKLTAMQLIMRLIMLALVLLLGRETLIAPAWAVEDSFYDVQGLQVRAKSKSEVAAKQAALRNGKQRAFKRMIARFLTNYDYERLQQPKLSVIEGMIRDIQLEEERYGGGIYIAVLNIRFRLEDVRAYLRKIGFAYSETSARPYLVLPVFVDLKNQSVYMWEGKNIWLDNWLDREDAYKQHLLPLILPHSPTHDEKLLPDVKLINQNRSIVNQIGDFYSTQNIILMTAVGDYQQKGNVLRGLQVTAHFLTKDWERKSLEVYLPNQDDATKLLSTARRQIFATIQDEWKQHTAIELGKENHLEVHVRIQKLQQWLAIEKVLRNVPDIIDFRLIKMNVNEAQIALTFYGTSERLERALAREFLGLVYHEDKKQWILQATQSLDSG